MLARFCFSLLLLQTVFDFRVSAQNDQPEDDEIEALSNSFNEISNPLVKVEYEVARAGYIPSERILAMGGATLYCEGAREIMKNIYWSRNGRRQQSSEFYDDPYQATVQSIYKLVSPDEARYDCNGLFVYLIKPPPAQESQNVSVYQNTKVTCIDKIATEETKALEKLDSMGFKTSIELFSNRVKLPLYPVKRRTISSDLTFQCNNTKHFTFVAETRPETTVSFKGKTVICESSDTKGRCELTIFFGDKVVATGMSPRLEHKYGKINIQQVKCTADCLIGDLNTLPLKDDVSIEINRTLYICVIFVIILIIIILIIIVCCVLWHKFGFKEKYGYQINMRLKKNFAVDTNKLSSYRMSGVQADVPVEVDGSDPDVVKEFRDMDDGSLDDSFVDPNFARTNNKVDMRSKDDISSSGASNQRPFLRI